MTHRDRVLALLQGSAPDRVPWFADLDYYYTALIADGKAPPDFKQSGDYIRRHADLGCGFYLQGHFPFRETYDSCTVRTDRRNGARIREIETPVGRLEEQSRYLPTSYSTATVKHLVETPHDLRVYRYFVEHTQYEADYERGLTRAEQIGTQGVLLLYTPRTPFMHLLAIDAGIENIMTLMMDAPDELTATIEVMEQSFGRAARIASESPADIVMIPENLSSEMVGPTYFDRYLKGPQSRWSEMIKAQGKYSCIHMDGTLKGLLRQEAELGLSFIEACTSAPVGDVPVDAWPDYIRGTDTVLWGGIPGLYFTEKVSDAEFDRHVEQVLSVMRQEPRYVLGVADQVPPDGLERRIRRVAELVELYGAYE